MFKDKNFDFSKAENTRVEGNDLELKKYFENSEIICVPIEMLIPGIKNKSFDVKLDQPHGRNLPDQYINNLVPEIYREFIKMHHLHPGKVVSTPENKEILELSSLKDQIVIDLGCTGSPKQSYLIASIFGAKGFVGVDAYDNPTSYFQDKTKTETIEMIKNKLDGYEESEEDNKPEIKPIPGAGEQEDMLSFLKRLPDNSVSIITSGIDEYVLHTFTGENEGLVDEIEKEIQRVLSSDGIYVSYQSVFRPKELVEMDDDYGLRIFKKHKQKEE